MVEESYSQLPFGWPETMTRAHSAYFAEAMKRNSERMNESRDQNDLDLMRVHYCVLVCLVGCLEYWI